MGQAMQYDEPVVGAKAPATQLTQTEDISTAKAPAGQLLQVVAPVVAEMAPAGQLSQPSEFGKDE